LGGEFRCWIGERRWNSQKGARIQQQLLHSCSGWDVRRRLDLIKGELLMEFTE
jgi:hypothetical protein